MPHVTIEPQDDSYRVTVENVDTLTVNIVGDAAWVNTPKDTALRRFLIEVHCQRYLAPIVADVEATDTGRLLVQVDSTYGNNPMKEAYLPYMRAAAAYHIACRPSRYLTV